MKLVGEKLGNVALAESDSVRKDLFGRSAFNRYYYAAFLVTREMLGDIEPKWKKTPHAEIPKLLTNAVRKPVINRLMQDAKKGIITSGELSLLETKLKRSTTELANLLIAAYDVRKVADYEPEIRVIENNKVIILNACKLTSANAWSDRASAYCKEIRKVWKDSGLV